MSNPLQSFLSAKQAGISMQNQQLNRDIALERQRQDRSLKGAQLMDKSIDFIMKSTNDPAARRQLFFNPQLEQVRQSYGIKVPQMATDNDFTNQSLMQLKSGLGQSMQQMTSGQINLEHQAQALVGSENPDTGQPFTRETALQSLIRRQAGIDRRAGVVTGAEAIATTPGVTDKVAASKKTIKEAEERGAGAGKVASDVIGESFDRIGKITANIRNIDRAIDAIDRGAGTGRAERLLPSVKAASIELDNMRNQLGLDVVGATTFGALSKGELDLALDTALPTGLNEPQLRDWLDRKKTAQQNLVDYLDNQIDFLEGGGTVGEWRTLITDAEDAIEKGADPGLVQDRLRQMARGQ